MATTLSTSLSTSLATSLCGGVIPPVDYTFDGEFEGNIQRSSGALATDDNFPSSYWAQPVGTTMTFHITGQDSFGNTINEYRTLTLASDEWWSEYYNYESFPYISVGTADTTTDGAEVYLEGELQAHSFNVNHIPPTGQPIDVIECEGQSYEGYAELYAGAEVTVTVTPSSGHVFDYFTFNGTTISTNPMVVTMPDENVLVEAHYSNQ